MRFGSFHRIPVWENRRRRRLLIQFRDLIARYEQQLPTSTMGDVYDSEESAQTRGELNRQLAEAELCVARAGISTVVTWTPPAAVGGYVQQVPVLTNLFNLHMHHIPFQSAIDIVDRAIGNYESDEENAWWRTFNPFFWLGLLLDYVAFVPFAIARRAGFQTQKIEDSWIGRTLKFVVWLLTAAALIVSLLQAFGIWDAALIKMGVKHAQPVLID